MNSLATTCKQLVAYGFVALLLTVLALPTGVHAQSSGEFSLQVTPSPLVTTLKPGTKTELDLKIRNAGSVTEDLKIEPRAFSFNDSTGQVTLKDTTPPDIADWVSFSAPKFTVKPGEWFTEKVRINLPENTGFSYSFALLISRQSNPTPTGGGRLLKGSVAVFTLVNVDRPGATRKLEIESFTTTKNRYEYLPVTFNVRLKNTGNTIVQPYGNIFVQRGADDNTPVATLPVNEARSYLLPGTTRTLTATWDAGFPAYQTSTAADGTETSKLVWDWSKVSEFRIGHYTAKLVAAYNDGRRDVPLQQETGFWVVPWKIIAGFTVVALLLLFSLWTIGRKLIRLFGRLRTRGSKKKGSSSSPGAEPPSV
jgi:hypothetical protein